MSAHELDPLINAAPEPPPNGLPDIPSEDYENARRTDAPAFQPLRQFLFGRLSAYRDATRSEFRRYHARNLRNQKYLQGEQFWDIDPESGQIYQVTPEREWSHIDNQFEYYIEAIVANILRSAPRLVVKTRTDDAEVQSDLRSAQHWMDCDRALSDADSAMESYQSVLRSRTWYYTAPVISQGGVKRPVVEVQRFGPQGGGAAYYCPSCGEGGTLNEQPQPVQDPSALPQDGGVAGTPGGPPQAQPPQPVGQSDPAAMGAPGGPGAGMPNGQGAPVGAGYQCPKCGSTDILAEPGESYEGYGVTDERMGPKVEISTELVDDFQMGWYEPAGSPYASPIIWRERMMLLTEIAERFSWLSEQSGASAQQQQQDFGLRFLDELSRSPGNWTSDPYVVGSNTQRVGMTDQLRRRFLEVWLEPAEYKHWTTPEPIPLASGKTIQANVPLGQTYPKGLCFVQIDDVLVDIRPEPKNDYWDSAEYKPNPAGGHARGAESLIPLQDIHNALRIYKMVHVATEANGTTFVNPKKVTAAGMRKNVNKPGRIVYVDGLLPGERMDTGVAMRLPGNPLSPETTNLERDNIGSMQAHAQVYAAHPNEDKAPINTATGVNEMASQIAQMAEPKLKRRAEVRAKIATKRLKFAQQYCFDEEFFENGEEGAEGKWITPALLSGEFWVEFDPESHVVRTNDQKKADVAAGVPLLLQAMQLQSPDLMRLVDKVFHLDEMNSFNIADSKAMASRRIKAIKKACAEALPQVMAEAQQAAMIPPGVDPATGQPVNPVEQVLQMAAQQIAQAAAKPDPRDDDDTITAEYTSYYRSSEGQEDDELVKAATLAAYAMQFANKTQKEQILATAAGLTQAAAAAPVAGQDAAQGEQKAEADHERGQRAADADAHRQREAPAQQGA